MTVSATSGASGSLSKQSSLSSNASESVSLKIERENSPVSLTASGDVSIVLSHMSYQS